MRVLVAILLVSCLAVFPLIGAASDPGELIIRDHEREIEYFSERGWTMIAAEEIDLTHVWLKRTDTEAIVTFQVMDLAETSRFPRGCEDYSMGFNASADESRGARHVVAFHCASGWQYFYDHKMANGTFRGAKINGSVDYQTNRITLHAPLDLFPSTAGGYLATSFISNIHTQNTLLWYRDIAGFHYGRRFEHVGAPHNEPVLDLILERHEPPSLP